MEKTKKQFIKKADANHFTCQNEWTLANLATIKSELTHLKSHFSGDIVFDGAALTKMDSAGAWLLTIWMPSQNKDFTLHREHFAPQHEKLLSLVNEKTPPKKTLSPPKLPGTLAFVGKIAYRQMEEFQKFLAFVGKLSLETLRVIRSPNRFRFSALVNVVEKAGVQALPIIALLSFMIGVVIAYQMGVQLRNYGANIFIVDFLGLSVLREFAPLITAIMVAGRSGSAFTAQLGTMKINQEIDALNTMGVSPEELLIFPKVLGLFIALPLLTMWADVFGVFGGMLMAQNMLGVTMPDFLMRFSHQIPFKTLLIGLGKAPVFALIIANIGCFQGMQVAGSADSVGKQTTRSVVLAIFFIIVADAIFSIIFSWLKL